MKWTWAAAGTAAVLFLILGVCIRAHRGCLPFQSDSKSGGFRAAAFVCAAAGVLGTLFLAAAGLAAWCIDRAVVWNNPLLLISVYLSLLTGLPVAWEIFGRAHDRRGFLRMKSIIWAAGYGASAIVSAFLVYRYPAGSAIVCAVWCVVFLFGLFFFSPGRLAAVFIPVFLSALYWITQKIEKYSDFWQQRALCFFLVLSLVFIVFGYVLNTGIRLYHVPGTGKRRSLPVVIIVYLSIFTCFFLVYSSVQSAEREVRASNEILHGYALQELSSLQESFARLAGLWALHTHAHNRKESDFRIPGEEVSIHIVLIDEPPGGVSHNLRFMLGVGIRHWFGLETIKEDYAQAYGAAFSYSDRILYTCTFYFKSVLKFEQVRFGDRPVYYELLRRDTADVILSSFSGYEPKGRNLSETVETAASLWHLPVQLKTLVVYDKLPAGSDVYPWIILGITVLFTATLLCAYFGASNRTMTIEKTVGERTMELHQSRESLKRSRSLLYSLIDAMPFGIYWKNPDLTLAGGNRVFADDAGINDITAIGGRRESECFWREQAAMYDIEDRKVLASGRAIINDEEPRRVSGNKLIWIQKSKIPVRTREGELIALLGIYADITREKDVQIRLKENEQKYSNVFMRTHDPILLHYPDGRIMELNPAADALVSRVSDPQLFEKLLMGVFTRTEVQETLKNYSQYTSDNPVEIFSGTEILYFQLFSSIIDHGHSVIQTILHDISRQKKKELKLQEEKTSAVIENRAKSQFIANISHEVRTPINAILGFSRIISRSNGNPEHVEYARIIEKSASSLLYLINNILDLSKMEAGRLPIYVTLFDIHGLLEDIADIFRLQVSEKNLIYQTVIGRDMPRYVRCDDLRLRQILFNLVGNAVKFTDTGGIVVSVNAVDKVGPRFTLQIDIRDTGIGIPPDEIDMVFQPFTQQTHQDTGKYGGTGLGLAICRRLTSLLKGDIRVKSTPGKGSVVTVTLPDVERGAPPAGFEADEEHASAGDRGLHEDMVFKPLPVETLMARREFKSKLKELIPVWKEISQSYGTRDIERLAMELAELGRAHDEPLVADIGERLGGYARNFDVELLQQELKMLASLFDTLEGKEQ